MYAAVPIQQLTALRHEVRSGRRSRANCWRRSDQDDHHPIQQSVYERTNRIVSIDYRKRRDAGPRAAVSSGTARQRTKRQSIRRAGVASSEADALLPALESAGCKPAARGNPRRQCWRVLACSRPARRGISCADSGSFRQYELQVVSERRFDRRDVFIGTSDFVRERTEHGLRLLLAQRERPRRSLSRDSCNCSSTFRARTCSACWRGRHRVPAQRGSTPDESRAAALAPPLCRGSSARRVFRLRRWPQIPASASPTGCVLLRAEPRKVSPGAPCFPVFANRAR